MKDFFKQFDYSLLLAVMAWFGVQHVTNLGFIIGIIVGLLFIILSSAYNKKNAIIVFSSIIILSAFTFLKIGTIQNRYLLTYENGTAICASRDKEFQDGCFSEYKKVKDGDKLGKFIKYEYIGKAFYK